MCCHWHSGHITGHDMKRVMVELYALSPLILYSGTRKACGFWGAGFYPYFYPLNFKWVGYWIALCCFLRAPLIFLNIPLDS